MKANEFFKLHDLDFIKHLIAQNSNLTADYFDTCALYSFNGTPVVDGIDVPRKPFFDDLKYLVESWELVESYGGIQKIREDTVDLEEWEENSELWKMVKQAIQDVESCQ